MSAEPRHTLNPGIAYHVRELERARTGSPRAHSGPHITESDQAILDVGCGIGQTFVASGLDDGRLLVGLDVDLDSLRYGNRQFDAFDFVNGTAAQLPFRAESFDLVIARVSLPYTDIPRSLAEISRVLRHNGRAWFALHSFGMTVRHLARSALALRLIDVVFRTYVITNGVAFHLFGRLFAFPLRRRHESFQTRRSISRCMRRVGFDDIRFPAGGQFVCTARKVGVPKVRDPVRLA